MKTSKKILTASGILVFVMMITGMIVFRNDVGEIMTKRQAGNLYRELVAGDFHALDFSPYWIVSIKQGKENKVEIEIDGDSLSGPVESINGTLHFKMDTLNAPGASRKFNARITARTLHFVRASRRSEISMHNFKSDSIEIILEDGSAFSGSNNQFRSINFKTSGNVRLQIEDDGD